MVSMNGCPQLSHRPRSRLAHFAKRPLSGLPNREPRPWAKPGGSSFGLLNVACSAVDHHVLGADEADVGVRLAHELLAVQAVAVEPLHADTGLHLECVRAAGARATHHGAAVELVVMSSDPFLFGGGDRGRRMPTRRSSEDEVEQPVRLPKGARSIVMLFQRPWT